MLKLSSVFSSHALYLQNSNLKVLGHTDAGAVTLTLNKGGEAILVKSVSVNSDGSFSVEFKTPAASFDKYEIKITAGEESVLLTDILFGELWLASGQSNMEWPVRYQPDNEAYMDSLASKNIRVYFVFPWVKTSDFPRKPLDDHEGKWATVTDKDIIRHVSALGMEFASSLYDFVNKNANIPIGILALCCGGVPIESYLIEESYMNNPDVVDYFEKTGKMPDSYEWNSKGEANNCQVGCLYNHLIAPTLGVRTRGLIWYQGENNVTYESKDPVYAKLLRELHLSYKERFADSGADYYFIAAMLYPWIYSQNALCNVFRINRAILEFALENPVERRCVPIYDLNFTWGFYMRNHPIHPTHKLGVGKRIAAIVESAVYGRKSKQTNPASVSSITCRNGKIYVKFKNTGSGLYVKGKLVRGIYIRSRNGKYTPAYCKIANKNTLEVYHPFVEKPRHVAYACSDFEYDCNLYAGEYPVVPFSSELPDNIYIKNWLNCELDSEPVYGTTPDGLIDCFRRPIFYPIGETEICFDSDYSDSARSIRMRARDEKFGVYVKSSVAHTLDMYNYKSLNASLLITGEAKPEFHIVYEDGEEYISLGNVICERYGTFSDYCFDLCGVKEKSISRIEFVFQRGEAYGVYANLEKIELIPKK